LFSIIYIGVTSGAGTSYDGDGGGDDLEFLSNFNIYVGLTAWGPIEALNISDIFISVILRLRLTTSSISSPTNILCNIKCTGLILA
jgi:hypothetical protein